MSRLRAALVLTAFVAMTLPGLPLQQAFIWFSPAAARRFPYRYHRAVAKLLGIKVRVKGSPATDSGCLLAVNHVSWLDIPILSSVAPLSFIAKREVASWPFFGTLARLQRSVFIDRERRHATGSSRNEMQQRLAQGETLVLFAEGTSSDGAHVLPFKSAFFAAADGSEATIQPVTLAYRGHWGTPMTRRRRPSYAWYGDMDMGPHLWAALAQGPIEVDVICHPPLRRREANDRKTLAREAEEAVRRGLLAALAGREGEPGFRAAGNGLGNAPRKDGAEAGSAW
jgi:lyso-ornithine lipid O-acyltransferase